MGSVRAGRVCLLCCGAILLLAGFGRGRTATEGRIQAPLPGRVSAYVLGVQLVEFVKRQDADRVRKLLDQGAKPTARDERGLTAWQLAVMRESDPIVQMLLRHGADPNTDFAVWNAACMPRMLHRLQMLLDAGAAPDQYSRDGRTPLMAAVMAQNQGAARLLLQHGARINRRAHDGSGQTALSFAVPRSYPLAELLVRRGADVNVADKDGQTPLVQAIGCIGFPNKDQFIRLLKGRGASYGASRGAGGAAFDAAIWQDDRGQVAQILQSGVDPNTKTRDAVPALALAATLGYREIVETLLRHGADANTTDRHGTTALMQAATVRAIHIGNHFGGSLQDRLAILALLLQQRANVNVRNDQGLTALDFAQRYGTYEMVQRLRQSGGKP